MKLFHILFNYGEYLKDYPSHQNLEIDVEDFSFSDKIFFLGLYFSVNSNAAISHKGNFNDLIFLSRMIVW